MGEQYSFLDGRSTELSVKRRVNGIDENSATNAWYVYARNGNVNTNNKWYTNYRVRPVSAPKEVIYDIPYEYIYRADLNNRRGKSSTNRYFEFSLNLHENIYNLWEDIRHGEYKVSPSMAFVVEKPVYREVFAPAMRDMEVQHLLAMFVGPLYEERHRKLGDISKSSRKGQGNLKAMKLLEDYVYEASKGYTEDCYIGEYDIQGFYMNIPMDKLWRQIEALINGRFTGTDKTMLLHLYKQTVYNEPQDNCTINCDPDMWSHIPPHKSRFSTHNIGTTLGSYNGKLDSDFYRTRLDDYIINVLGIKRYVAFVDDFRIVFKTIDEWREVTKKIATFLREEMGLTLHPKKCKVEHYAKGSLFVGGMILPRRRYVSNRTVGNLYKRLHAYEENPSCDVNQMARSMNAYLGMMIHYDTYNIRKKICERIMAKWGDKVYIQGNYNVVKVRAKYIPEKVFKKRVIKGDRTIYEPTRWN